MEIVVAKPPCWNAVLAAGFLPAKGTIFTWGEQIFNPDGISVDYAQIAHEAKHAKQQAEIGGPEKWWEKWLTDPAWRAEQEAQGYGAQYAELCIHVQNRDRRAMYLSALCDAILSPQYGLVGITKENARHAILKRAT